MNMNDLKLSDLREDHRIAAEVVGLETYMDLCRVFGGTAIYMITRKTLYFNYYKKLILADRGKHSCKELAKIYPVSESTVRNIRRNADPENARDIPGSFSMDNLPQELYDMAGLIGLELLLKLCDVCGGSFFYIPTEREATMKYIKRKILENRDFFSKKELARIYNVSLSTVYNVLRERGK